MDVRDVGARIRRLRLIAGLGQLEFADRIGISSGSVSQLENGRVAISAELLDPLCRVLDCTSTFLLAKHETIPPVRPWMRAYADAPKREVDRQLADCMTAHEVIDTLTLRVIPDTIPVFDGDPTDDDAIEEFAMTVRAAASLEEGDVVGNMIRAAERLGCLVLPMPSELGRHLGLSTRVNLAPVVAVSRPSFEARFHVSGDRQRFTVAHELGHLALHSTMRPPNTAAEAAHIERQAHRFAGAFLAPADAMLEEIRDGGGRVTLRFLANVKERWGVAIKALVVRFHSLGVIDEHHARSLYKQISARGWNKQEPVIVGNESAIWFLKALERRFPSTTDLQDTAASSAGVGLRHLVRWTDWSSTAARATSAEVVDLPLSRRNSSHRGPASGGVVRDLPLRTPE